MRIRIVNQYFPPDTSATAYVFDDIARAFAERGHEVTILCGRPSYDPAERRNWRPLRAELSDGVRIERVGSAAGDRRSGKRRAVNYLTYLAAAPLRGLTAGRPDFIIAGSDPPLAVWAALISAKGRPVVYSLQDLHPDMALAAGMMQPGAAARMWERIHTAAMKRCHTVVCLGETMAARVRAKGVHNVVVIPNGSRLDVGDSDPVVVKTIRDDASFVALHAGNLGGAGAWDTLNAAQERLGTQATIAFVGDGSEAARIRARGSKVMPFLPKEQLASVMAAGDMQIVTQKKGMEGLVVPSKLYSILAHGRPVLAVVPRHSEVAKVVSDYKCGLVADPENPEEVAKQVLFAKAHPEELALMATRAREASKHFDRDVLMGQFVDLVEHIAGRRS